jgi:hypothetical protein
MILGASFKNTGFAAKVLTCFVVLECWSIGESKKLNSNSILNFITPLVQLTSA